MVPGAVPSLSPLSCQAEARPAVWEAARHLSLQARSEAAGVTQAQFSRQSREGRPGQPNCVCGTGEGRGARSGRRRGCPGAGGRSHGPGRADHVRAARHHLGGTSEVAAAATDRNVTYRRMRPCSRPPRKCEAGQAGSVTTAEVGPRPSTRGRGAWGQGADAPLQVFVLEGSLLPRRASLIVF